MKTAIINSNKDTISYVYSDAQRKRLAGASEMLPGVFSKEDAIAGKLAEVECLFSTWGMPSFTEDEIRKHLPSLRAVFYAAGATDGFAQPFLARNIHVMSAWKSNAVPVAELCHSLIMLSLKGYFRNVRECQASKAFGPVGPGAYGETVALIGSGAVVNRLSSMLAQHDLKVVVVNSWRHLRTMSIEEAFRTAQVISNHLPDADDLVREIRREHFESMRLGATFINTGRGRQVDEQGLCDVLAKRPDLTALLDVTHPEPPKPDSPLFTLPNLLRSSHIAGSFNDEVHRMSDSAINDFIKFAATGELSENFITVDSLIVSKK